MELREIMTFLQVAQQKSFSKAARQLGYSQAAVTIQIKQLEKELNVRLFDRIGKQTTLTHQGNVFYHHAVSIIQDLENARDAVKRLQNLQEGSVSEQSSPSVPPYCPGSWRNTTVFIQGST